MIQLVLNDSMQHEINGVFFSAGEAFEFVIR